MSRDQTPAPIDSALHRSDSEAAAEALDPVRRLIETAVATLTCP